MRSRAEINLVNKEDEHSFASCHMKNTTCYVEGAEKVVGSGKCVKVRNKCPRKSFFSLMVVCQV